MTTITKRLFATLLSSVCFGVAQATPVTVDFGIPGDLLAAPYNNVNAGWYVEFTSGDPSLRIDSVTVNIAPRLRVNVGGCLLTNGCGFDAAAVAGANVGTPGFTGSSSIANGTASFTLNFADFDPGERFRFLLDLDDTIIVPFPANPFSNAVTAADLIDGGNTISYSVQFSCTGYTTTSLTGALSFSETLDTSELPRFIEDELDAFLEFGILAHGYQRLLCGDCGPGQAAGCRDPIPAPPWAPFWP